MVTYIMKNFFKRNWGYILLSILLLIICIISFVPGKYLLSNDNYSPELNPLLTFQRSLLSPAWRSYRVLGFASDSEQADIFRSIFFFLGEKVFNANILGQLYYLFGLFIGSFFTALLTKSLFESTKLKKYSNVGFVISGITYIGTLWTVWIFYQTMAPYISNFAFLPLLLYLIYRYLKDSNSKNLLFVFLGSLVFSSVSVIATLFVADIFFIIFFTISLSYTIERNWKSTLKKSLKVLLTILITQLFWILPFLFYTFETSKDIIGSYINKSITLSVIDLEAQMQSAINTARLYSRILTDSNGNDLLFQYAKDYFTYDFYKVVGLLPALLSLIAIPFLFLKRNYKLLVFVLCGLGVWFLIKVTNPPFGGIFTWMQENIPLFKQVLRWPSSKLSEIYVICLSVCTPFGFLYLLNFFFSNLKKKWLQVFVVILFSVFSFGGLYLYNEYIFKGDLFPKSALVEIPQEYLNLKEYLEKNDTKGRIYYAPPSNNNYFRNYTWGFRGSQFISYILPNPVMDMSSAVGSSYGERAMLEIQGAFRAGDRDSFLKHMDKYDVEYILVDKSLVIDGFVFDINWDVSDQLFKDLETLWKDGDLTLYKSNVVQDVALVESLGRESFERVSPQRPAIYPYEMSLADYKLNGGYISGSFKYEGGTQLVTNNLDEINWKNLPTGIKKENGILKIYPVYPKIKEEISELRYGKYINFSQDYSLYSLAGNVLTEKQIIDGINISEEYVKVKGISMFKENSFKRLDLTETLTKGTSDDCNNGTLNYSVTVSDQGNASGLTLESKGSKGCLYSKFQVNPVQDYVAKLVVNWESEGSSIPGICLYSSKKQECLNDERYFSSKEAFGEVEIVISKMIQKGDSLSVILYSLGTGEKAEVTFRDVALLWSDTGELKELREVKEYAPIDTILLEKDSQYLISIPVLLGGDSYIYTGENNLIWEPNLNTDSTITWDNGMYQSVKSNFINQSTNLFSTSPFSKYLVYWSGKNISNIPASICLVYSGENKCWYQDMFSDAFAQNKVEFFESKDSFTNRLDAVYTSTSYKSFSENVLEEFVVMKSPLLWSDVVYSSGSVDEFKETEMQELGNWKIYKLGEAQIGENTLISIPQAESDGWIMINNLKILNERVLINGWKQGWDVSGIDAGEFYVIYWPNLLGYLGYLSIIGLGITLTIKSLRKNKTYAK